MRKKLPICLAAATLLTSLTAVRPAHATDDVAEPASTGKGITGGVLLGAEVVTLIEAAFKVKPTSAYLLGGLAGGVAGGVGGYFVEHGGNAKASMYMLTGGMVLLIPTTVAVLSAKAYEPPADYTEDKGMSDQPVAEPAQPSSSEPAVPAPPPAAGPEGSRATTKEHRVARRRAPREVKHLPIAPPALVGVGEGSLTLSMPAVEIRDVFSRTELAQYGLKQATEVRVPVFNVLF